MAINSAGEATNSTTLEVTSKAHICLDPINEQSFAHIKELEALKPERAIIEEPVFETPSITVSLITIPSENIEEGDSVHIEGQFTPIADPNLKVKFK